MKKNIDEKNKNRKERKKGFTLTELLVTIVILGIVMGLAFPIIKSIQKTMNEKKYNAYYEGVLHSAKLYVNSYEEDLFGNLDYGCEIIKYSELANKKLIKDIEISDISCATDETKIRVSKINGKHYYTANVNCGKLDNSGKIIEKKYSNNKIREGDSCDTDFNGIIRVIVTPEQFTGNTKKKVKMRVNMSSATGINQGFLMYYRFVNESNNVVGEDWKNVVFKLPSENAQRNLIEKDNSSDVIVDSDEITTPNNVTNDLKIQIKIDRLNDLAGRNWTNDVGKTGIESGPYRVDNSNPIVLAYTVKSNNATYNSLTPIISLNANDKNYTSVNKYSAINELRVCYYYDTNANKCNFAKQELKNHKLYNDVNNEIMDTIPTTSGNYDGSTHKIHAFVFDNANNRTDLGEVNYTVAARIIYNAGNGTGSMSDSKCNVGADCTIKSNSFTYTGHTFTGWNTKSDGTGTNYTERQVIQLQGNVTLYAQWRLNEVRISYNMNGGWLAAQHLADITASGNQVLYKGNTVNQIVYYNGNTGSDGLWNYNNSSWLNIIRDTYHIKNGLEWSVNADGSGTVYDQSDNYSAERLCSTIANGDCNITLYANWKPNRVIFKIKSDTEETLGGAYSWTRGNDNVLKKDGVIYSTEIKQGTNVPLDLPNYNNDGFLNIFKAGHQAISGQQWKCDSGCRSSGMTFNHSAITIANTDNICVPRDGECTVYLKVNWRINKINIQLHMNGGSLAPEHGSSIGTSGSYITNITNNNSTIIHSINYGSSIGSNGLADYNNPNDINIVRSDYIVKAGEEWNTSSNGRGTTFKQNENYAGSRFCDATYDDCTITLYLKWKPATSKPYYTNDGHQYDYLQTAIDNTASGKTIYLSKNYDDSSGATLNTNKTLTFNANGHILNLTRNSISVSSGKMNFKNGTINTTQRDSSSITCTGGTVNLKGSLTVSSSYTTDTELGTEAIKITGGTVNISDRNVTVKSGIGNSSGYARAVFITGGRLNFSAGTIIADASKDSGYGGTGINNSGGNVQMTGGNIIISKVARKRCGLCVNSGTTNVTGGSITIRGKVSGSHAGGHGIWKDDSSSATLTCSGVTMNIASGIDNNECKNL